MQQLFAAFAARQQIADGFAHAAEPGCPRFVLRTELAFQFPAHPLRQRGAVAAGGDGDLKFTAADDRGSVKVAMAGIVDRIGERARLPRFLIDAAIELFGVGCGDYEEVSFGHAGAVRQCDVLEAALVRPQQYARRDLRRNYGNISGRAEHGFNLLLGDETAADNKDLVAFELEKNWI